MDELDCDELEDEDELLELLSYELDEDEDDTELLDDDDELDDEELLDELLFDDEELLDELLELDEDELLDDDSSVPDAPSTTKSNVIDPLVPWY